MSEEAVYRAYIPPFVIADDKAARIAELYDESGSADEFIGMLETQINAWEAEEYVKRVRKQLMEIAEEARTYKEP